MKNTDGMGEICIDGLVAFVVWQSEKGAPLMAKVHKSVGIGRGEIKADSISPRLYTVKLRPICPKNNAKSSTSLSILQYLAVSTRVLAKKYCSTWP